MINFLIWALMMTMIMMDSGPFIKYYKRLCWEIKFYFIAGKHLLYFNGIAMQKIILYSVLNSNSSLRKLFNCHWSIYLFWI